MTSKLTRDIIQSEIADFFAGVVEIHTELGGPNTVEEAQNQLTDRVLACVPEVDSEPVAWEVKGILCHTLDEARKYVGVPEPLYADPRLEPESAEPVAYMYDGEDGREYNGHDEFSGGGKGIPLYRHAQPAPVVPDNRAITQHFDTIALETARGILCDVNRRHEFLGGEVQLLSRVQCRIDAACRAATLQAAPVCTCPSGDGSLRWPCPSHPGNSPVIPDGWTGNDKANAALMMLDRIETVDPVDDDRIDGIKRIIHELAAALQPQNAPQNIPEIIPGWIPVSERMPDDDDFVYILPRPDFGVELHVGQYCECSPKGDGWYAQVYEQNYGIEWYPITVTHWMPLPAAPQEVKGE